MEGVWEDKAAKVLFYKNCCPGLGKPEMEVKKSENTGIESLRDRSGYRRGCDYEKRRASL